MRPLPLILMVIWRREREKEVAAFGKMTEQNFWHYGLHCKPIVFSNRICWHILCVNRTTLIIWTEASLKLPPWKNQVNILGHVVVNWTATLFFAITLKCDRESESLAEKQFLKRFTYPFRWQIGTSIFSTPGLRQSSDCFASDSWKREHQQTCEREPR